MPIWIYFKKNELFQKKYKVDDPNWTNYILLLSNQLPEWNQIVDNYNSSTIINALTWEDVCIALRRTLQSKESIIWKVWAYTYLGAVEQLIIGYKGYLLKTNLRPKENLDKKVLILEKGIYHE